MTNWGERYPWAEHCESLPEPPGHPPKEQWADGPWQNEPELVRWTTLIGPPGLIWRSTVTGSLCGYAAVRPGHPLHGRDYQLVEQALDAPWGLSFAGPRDAHPDDSLWWFGFDHGHWMDQQPAMDALLGGLRHPRHWARYVASGIPIPGPYQSLFAGGTYHTVDMVRVEVEALAVQLQAASNPHVQEALARAMAGEKVDEE